MSTHPWLAERTAKFDSSGIRKGVEIARGRCVTIDTYPDFRIDPERVAAAITPRTKMILLNSPANPTGAVGSREEISALAAIAARHNIALVSDEIYHEFCFDGPMS